MKTIAQAYEGLTEDKFATGYYAFDDRGEMVGAKSEQARRFCAMGWLRRTNLYDVLFDKVNAIALRLGYTSIPHANDDLGYEFIKILQREGEK